jgi:hypothetical protein
VQDAKVRTDKRGDTDRQNSQGEQTEESGIRGKRKKREAFRKEKLSAMPRRD